MNILELPTEILLIILKHLDTKSLHNVYNASRYLRKLTITFGVVKSFDISRSVLASVTTLGRSFFKEVSSHIEEINLYAVQGVTKSSILVACKKLKCLKTVNLAFTPITIPDLTEIYERCPTIKNVTINFNFGQLGKISTALLNETVELFKHFENVTFVISCSYLSNLPLYILETAKVRSIKFILTSYNFMSSYCEVPLDFVCNVNQFSALICSWKLENTYHNYISTMGIAKYLVLEHYEYILLNTVINELRIKCSKVFKGFFEKAFSIPEETISYEINYQKPIKTCGNISIMVWKRETTEFNDLFFERLYNKLKDSFPCSLNLPNMDINWYNIRVMQEDHSTLNETMEPLFKKRRIAPKNVILSYNIPFVNYRELQLSFTFDNCLKNPIAFPNQAEYMKKITYLSLKATKVSLSADLFSVIFSSCIKLETLNVELPLCSLQLSKSVSHSKSLKNIRIVDTRFSYNVLFESLSQCEFIENIHIIDRNCENPSLVNVPSIIQKCKYLYNFYMCCSNMSKTFKTRNLKIMNDVKRKHNKNHINIELHKAYDDETFGFGPFVDVFKLNPLKLI